MAIKLTGRVGEEDVEREFNQPEIYLGRDINDERIQNGLFIEDNYVSRVHCVIVEYGKGKYSVKDLGSKNGTFVNGHMADKETSVKSGDILGLAGIIKLKIEVI